MFTTRRIVNVFTIKKKSPSLSIICNQHYAKPFSHFSIISPRQNISNRAFFHFNTTSNSVAKLLKLNNTPIPYKVDRKVKPNPPNIEHSVLFFNKNTLLIIVVIAAAIILYLYEESTDYSDFDFFSPKLKTVDIEKLYHVDITQDNQVEVTIAPDSKYYEIHPVEFKPQTSIISNCTRGIKFLARTCIVGFIGVLLITTGLVTYNFPILNSLYLQHKWEDGLVYCLKTGGACMIKLGQWAATRPDLFPYELCQKLSNFHDSAPVHDFEHTYEIIRESFGKPIEELFLEFDRVPIASGAIAQVYKAVDLNGNQVAVKVRHPNVEYIVDQDLFLLHFFSVTISKLPGMKWMSLVEATDKFAESMREQLDLVTEAYNLVRFQHNFEHFPKVRFPTPIFPLCSERVLVESFEKGEKVSEYIHPDSSARINNSPEFAKKLATLGFSTFLKMIFIDNLIHTDLHPGNILVRESADNEPEVVLLDAGLTTSLADVDRKNFIDLFSSVAHKDCRKGASLMIDRARNQVIPPTLEQQELFKEEMDLFFTEITQMSLSNIPIGPSFMQMVNICRQCHVKIEGNFSTMVGGLVVIEGLSRQLNADFDLMEESLPLLSEDKELRNQYLKSIISGKQTKNKKDVMKAGITMFKVYIQRGKDFVLSYF